MSAWIEAKDKAYKAEKRVETVFRKTFPLGCQAFVKQNSRAAWSSCTVVTHSCGTRVRILNHKSGKTYFLNAYEDNFSAAPPEGAKP